jgi:CRISPR-associated protein Csx3
MTHPLPAVMIGGPPHAGKSVLFYNITHELRRRGVRHHAIRACPDGEGNWFQESDPQIVSLIRKKLDEWPDEFVRRIRFDLEHRCLPFLVDLGGKPEANQVPIVRQCTDAVLLLRADKEDYTQGWRHLVTENKLTPLAEIYSQLDGSSTITAEDPLLEGTITGLERHNTATLQSDLFKALVDRIKTLFSSPPTEELEKIFFEQAPTKPVINLYATAPNRWKLEMLLTFLSSLSTQEPLSVYGAAPNWVYGAIAAHMEQPLYQFDPRFSFGWTQPVQVRISTKLSPEIHIEPQDYPDMTVLSVSFPFKHLEYFQPNPLPFPAISTEKGLILDGPLPFWLLTSLVRLYKQLGVPWIAVHHLPFNKAVVVHSRMTTPALSDTLPMPGR